MNWNIEKEINYGEIRQWFKWYDNQVSQAQRAQRTDTEWQANDGVKTYTTLAELDAEANAKQNEIKTLFGSVTE